MISIRRKTAKPIALSIKAATQFFSLSALCYTLLACQENETIEQSTETDSALENYLRLSMASTPQADKSPLGIADINATALVSAESTTSAEYSQTNNQENGVNEADLVKFDGRYLYIAQQPTHAYQPIFIKEPDISPEKSSPVSGIASQTSYYLPTPLPSLLESGVIRVMAPDSSPTAPQLTQIQLGEDVEEILGMYTSQQTDNRQLLTLINRKTQSPANAKNNSMQPYYNYSPQTQVQIVDVKEPDQAEKLWQLSFEGRLINSRRIDNKLYLVTQFQTQLPWDLSADEISKTNLSDFLPHVVSESPSRPLFEATDCVVPSTSRPNPYPAMVTIIAIDLNQPENWQASCLAGAVSDIYNSSTATYLIASPNYLEDISEQRTAIHKFSLGTDQPEYHGTGTVPGQLNYPMAFAMGEYKGVLRVISSQYNQANDPAGSIKHYASSLAESEESPLSLRTIGQIPNSQADKPIGKINENIYSTRFFADRAYVVTYQRTDPLYVINFSKPETPFIEGEVELPGFSEYLHPLGENYVLGLGIQTREGKEGQVLRDGLKLALFDVSNPSQPWVEQEIIIGQRGTSSPALYDHKAISFLKKSQTSYRFALPISLYTDAENSFPSWQHNGLYLFDLNLNHNKALSLAGSLITEEKSNELRSIPNDKHLNQVQRSLIIDANVHYIDHGRVWSAPWDTPENSTQAQ